MKTIASIIILAAGLLLGGCAHVFDSIDQNLPEGSAAKVSYTRTGKFSSTTFDADAWEKTPERVSAKRIVMQHTNAWIPNIKVEVLDYERPRNSVK